MVDSQSISKTTGIAGYTLLYNSFGMQLVAHQHFDSRDKVLSDGADELSVRRVVDEELQRKKLEIPMTVKYSKNKSAS